MNKILRYQKLALNYVIPLYEKVNVFPEKKNIFKSLELVSKLSNVKVVILGQDPYYQKGQATGLAFALPLGVPPTVSLSAIMGSFYNKKLSLYADTTLESWAKQGVLLLNTALTVEENKPNSHALIWRPFIEEIIKAISENNNNVCFLLWGSNARSFEKYINKSKHFIYLEQHPARAKLRFDGGFVKANNYLNSKNINTIKW